MYNRGNHAGCAEEYESALEDVAEHLAMPKVRRIFIHLTVAEHVANSPVFCAVSCLRGVSSTRIVGGWSHYEYSSVRDEFLRRPWHTTQRAEKGFSAQTGPRFRHHICRP